MNTPARRDGTPERSKRGYEPSSGSQPARGRTDRSARSGDSYGNSSRGSAPRAGGARGDSQSYGGGSSRGGSTGDSRGGSRGGSSSYDSPRGGSRGGSDSRGGSGSYGGSSRGGYEGSRGGSAPRSGGYEGSRGGSAPRSGGYQGSRDGGAPRSGGYQGSRDGGAPRSGGYQGSRDGGAPRSGGYQGSRDGGAPRSGGYQGSRDNAAPRSGGYQGSRDSGSSRGGYEGSRGGSAPRSGGYQGSRDGSAPRSGGYEGSRGAAPSARTGAGAPRGNDSRGTQGRSGFAGRSFAPSVAPAPKKVHRPSPDVSVLLSNAKPAKHQHVEVESGGPKKLPWGEGERLQKVLAKAGVASRRAAEEMIEAGRIEVDGKIVKEQGLRIDAQNAVVRVDGVRVVVRSEQVYLALNKPKGWQSTMSDEMGRPCVGDIVAERVAAGQRLFHVGRLDADTEGLLLLTNDGDLAHRLMHPSYEVSKTYLATVNGEVRERQISKLLRDGIELDDGPAKVDKFQVLEVGEGKSLVKLVLHEGRKHIVRRLLAAVDHPVISLVRTHIGPVALGDQRPGALRVLGSDEIGKLYGAVSL